jgi:predicted nucleotidyltransferase
MSNIGLKLRELRLKSGLSLRQTASLIHNDVAVLSKMERGERRLNKMIIIKLAELYKADPDELLIQFLGEKVSHDLQDEVLGAKALEVAEQAILYRKSSKPELKEAIQKSVSVIMQDDRVEKAWIFGSYSRNELKPGSDLDIMIRIRDGADYSLYDLAEIQYRLENALGLKVDIAEEGTMPGLVRETVETEKILIYG